MSDLFDQYNSMLAKRNNYDYSDLKRLLIACGFELRDKHATHSVFKHKSLKNILTIVRDGNKVKKGIYVSLAKKAIDELMDIGEVNLKGE